MPGLLLPGEARGSFSLDSAAVSRLGVGIKSG